MVVSSTQASASPTNNYYVSFVVTFSESVTGVDASDFALTTIGLSGAAITNVSGSGSAYTVTAYTGTGHGFIRLDVADNDSITDAVGNKLGGAGAGNGNYSNGQSYSVRPLAFIAPPDEYAAWDVLPQSPSEEQNLG
jgi:MSHA biogenesis protein MshQ